METDGHLAAEAADAHHHGQSQQEQGEIEQDRAGPIRPIGRWGPRPGYGSGPFEAGNPPGLQCHWPPKPAQLTLSLQGHRIAVL